MQLLTEKVGALLSEQRDEATASFLKLETSQSPPKDPIRLLVITADGGRVQTRQEDPDHKWKEDKIGAVYEATPSPEQPGLDYQGPKPIRRSVVATMAPWRELGDHLSALADRRGYAHALQKVFVSDGAGNIRTERERGFFDASFVLDWGHAVEHLHQDAVAAFGPGPKADTWYEQQKDRLWKGHLDRFVKEVATVSRRLGPPPEHAPPGDPRRILATDLKFFKTNRHGLHYPSFRKRGWPIGSGIIESTIKQIGKRMKGTEKHWSMQRAEQTLQVAAQLVSEDGSWDNFWKAYPLAKAA